MSDAEDKMRDVVGLLSPQELTSLARLSTDAPLPDYPVRETIAPPSVAEPATAFDYSQTIVPVNDNARSKPALAADNPPLTVEDANDQDKKLLQDIEDKISEVEQLLKTNPDDVKLNAILKKLQGALQGGMSAQAVLAVLMDADMAVTEASGNDDLQQASSSVLAPTDFWELHHKELEEINRLRDDAVNAGVMDKKTDDDLKTREEELDKRAKEIDAMPEGKEKDEATAKFKDDMRAFYGDSAEAMEQAAKEAETKGMHELAKKLHSAAQGLGGWASVMEIDINKSINTPATEAVDQIGEAKKSEGNQVTTKDDSNPVIALPHMERLPEGDDTTAVSSVSTSIKLTVTDVTQNDIEAPSGGKNRSANRAVAKNT